MINSCIRGFIIIFIVGFFWGYTIKTIIKTHFFVGFNDVLVVNDLKEDLIDFNEFK